MAPLLRRAPPSATTGVTQALIWLALRASIARLGSIHWLALPADARHVPPVISPLPRLVRNGK